MTAELEAGAGGQRASLREMAGLVLLRVVVPLWILTGAGFKLAAASPKNLPRSVLKTATALGITDLFLWLAVLIAIEVAVAAVIVLLPRLARVGAAGLLLVFCGVLIAELMRGATNCGCLGTRSPSPQTMLGIDGALLLGLVFLRPPRPAGATPKWRYGLAGLVAAAGLATSLALLLPLGKAPAPTAGSPDGASSAGTPGGKPRPAAWYLESAEAWIGLPWREVELFQFMPIKPTDLDVGTRHVIFYKRDCDHCEQMFYFDLSRPLPDPITAVEIPQSREAMRINPAWDMPETTCELLELPVGTDWIITAPLIITVQDGFVVCAEEGDHKGCLGIQ